MATAIEPLDPSGRLEAYVGKNTAVAVDRCSRGVSTQTGNPYDLLIAKPGADFYSAKVYRLRVPAPNCSGQVRGTLARVLTARIVQKRISRAIVYRERVRNLNGQRDAYIKIAWCVDWLRKRVTLKTEYKVREAFRETFCSHQSLWGKDNAMKFLRAEGFETGALCR